jgi:hypothetical protein
MVGVKVGKGVFVTIGDATSVPAAGVVVAGNVLSTNRFGVLVAGKENGVTVG